MGCDIYLYTESFRNNRWEPNEDIRKDPYNEGENYIGLTYDESFYKGRNYILFDTLAGVRGGGFYQKFETKHKLPDDVSPQVKEYFEYWKRDAHTPSYITLSELEDYLETDFRLDIDNLKANINEWIERLMDVTKNPYDEQVSTDIYEVVDKMQGYLDGPGLDEEEVWVYNEIEDWVSRLKQFEGDDHRLVFWFDN